MYENRKRIHMEWSVGVLTNSSWQNDLLSTEFQCFIEKVGADPWLGQWNRGSAEEKFTCSMALDVVLGDLGNTVSSQRKLTKILLRLEKKSVVRNLD